METAMAHTDHSLSENISVEADGPVRVVRLNRPDHLNAFDDGMHSEFPRLWSQLGRDVDARAVVLTGAGRAFCAGGNRSEFELHRTDLVRRREAIRQARRLVEEMLNFPLPVVAAVNGPAVGLGCTLATLCDIVFIADDAYLQDSHVSVALVAGDGGAVTWPAATSLLLAKQYLLTGDRIPAAVRMGLANFSTPRQRLLDDAIDFAHRLAAQPAQAVRETKAVLNLHLRQAAALTLDYGLAAEFYSHDTPEYARHASGFAGPATDQT
jgi:enoyl-CoA hydratase